MTSATETGCAGPDRHLGHLCKLVEQGGSWEIAERPGNPRFSCRNCVAFANRAGDLCRPQALDRD